VRTTGPSGVMAEQVHPHTGAPMSVSPLTWSHATMALTTLEWLDRRRALLAQAHRADPIGAA
jgi:GH15 family glucan-1,4-alpha-glucosidase